MIFKHRYYTTNEGRVIVWQPGQDPRMQWGPMDITGNDWALQQLFRDVGPTDEAIVATYVPFEIVRILSAL